MTNSLVKWLTKRDIFGAPITVLYKGSDAFRTRLGAFFTILTYILILVQLISLSTAFIDGSKQDTKSQTSAIERLNAGSFNLKENHFDLKIATLKPIPS